MADNYVCFLTQHAVPRAMTLPEIQQATVADSTLQILSNLITTGGIFATHGIPKVLKSDNGPPFQSHEFSLYLKELGIKHKPSSPLWPQGNGQAENFMKPLVKAVKSAHHENKDWKREMFKFLLNYRATPHSTTGKSPSGLLYNRKIKTKLPQVTVENDSSLHQEVKERDERLKKNQKEYADSKRRVKCADIKKSDLGLVRQPKSNKMSTKYDPIPYEVTNRRGNRITAIRNGKYITRNISFFKKYHPRHGRSLESTEIMDEENYSSNEDVHEEHEQYDGLRQNDRPRQHNGQRQDDGPRYPARERQRVYRYGNNIYD
ncbi:PREDICTED: uncharacterized protein K02A2.6-like [Paramuricea clavata]|uniref:PREDICTED: uncharacterized protein K02A2.6-like n=1 Tax=Paramuricea clavata TaxID=317549 RepID=A0A7D9M0V4_PARCT|nr:PREDICTED: uncharacterized protein K02A2.6-like [Paramuricea clavata]